jgi:hypothetical protein
MAYASTGRRTDAALAGVAARTARGRARGVVLGGIREDFDFLGK